MTIDPGFLKLRAEQLAVVHLTRRSDLMVAGLKDADYGFDLLVSILKDNRKVGRSFGIQIKATISKSGVHRRNGHYETALKLPDIASLADITFPVCLFLFTMEDDHGYWKWIMEPTRDPARSRILTPNESNVLSALTDEELEHLIAQVNDWYEMAA